jgi:hypothetical protein
MDESKDLARLAILIVFVHYQYISRGPASLQAVRPLSHGDS